MRPPTPGLLAMLLAACLLMGQPVHAQGLGSARAIAVEPGTPMAEQRIALVMGNEAYEMAPLRNPGNDARALASVLRDCGFQVDLVINANRYTMFKAIRTFGQRIEGGGVGLFYFAGHGIAVKGINYLIPVATEITSEEEVEIQALSVQSVLNKMEAARNRLNILILDACRNNPFGRGSRSGSQGLAQVDAPTGSFISYATAPGATTSDGEGANGLFTEHLLKVMGQPGLKVEEVFKRVRVNVKHASNDLQIPWDSSSLTGDFVFRPGVEVAAPLPPPLPVSIPVPVLPASIPVPILPVSIPVPVSKPQSKPPAPSATPKAAPKLDRKVSDWVAYQTALDQAVDRLRAMLARQELSNASKLEALEAVAGQWSEDNPYSGKDKQERAWIRTQALVLHRAQLGEVCADRTLSPGDMLARLERLEQHWSDTHPEFKSDQAENSWMVDTRMALRMASLKGLLAQPDLKTQDKLTHLDEALDSWFQEVPLAEASLKARTLLQEQADDLRLTQSIEVGVQAKLTLSEEGFASWLAEEHAKLAPVLSGSAKGQQYLDWLVTGQAGNFMEWTQYQNNMDQGMAQMRTLLARADTSPSVKLRALEEAQKQWATVNPYAEKDKEERIWMRGQAQDLRLAMMAGYLARRDLKAEDRLKVLEEADRTWFTDKVLVDEETRAQAWIRTRAAAQRLAPSGAAAWAMRSGAPAALEAWRREERLRLAGPLAGTQNGEQYLKWLETGQGDWAGFDEGLTPGERRVEPCFGLELLWLPPGRFVMGTDKEGRAEGPGHAVKLTRGFWLGATDVTVAQFRRFVVATGYVTQAEREGGASLATMLGLTKKADANWRNPHFPQNDNHPVVCVSWKDAQAYLQWLNQGTGGGYRLPTEAEWEYACRGDGGPEAPGAPDAIAWHEDNSGAATHPVAKKEANAFGLFDMLGNVSQWCQDWYGEYAASGSTDPQGPATGTRRVLRGAAWNAGASSLRPTLRTGYEPEGRTQLLGFRVVRIAR